MFRPLPLTMTLVLALALAPLLMPASYSPIAHTTSESAAQGLAGAWLWPPLAVLTVWPLFVLVPGWALVAWGSRGRTRLASTGRLGLAVVLSVAVSAHLVWWLSSVTGYGREAVFVAAALLALPLPWAAGRLPPDWRRALSDAFRGARRALRRRAGPRRPSRAGERRPTPAPLRRRHRPAAQERAWRGRGQGARGGERRRRSRSARRGSLMAEAAGPCSGRSAARCSP